MTSYSKKINDRLVYILPLVRIFVLYDVILYALYDASAKSAEIIYFLLHPLTQGFESSAATTSKCLAVLLTKGHINELFR